MGAARPKGSSWDLGDGSCLLSNAQSLQPPAESHKPCRGAGAGLWDVFVPKGSGETGCTVWRSYPGHHRVEGLLAPIPAPIRL